MTTPREPYAAASPNPGDTDERRDERIALALTEIDPSLAGLFRHGRTLCAEPDSPGLAYLIGHAGRELSSCVIRELQPADALPREGRWQEELRRELAAALELPVEHERVGHVAERISSLPNRPTDRESHGSSDLQMTDQFRPRIASALQLEDGDPAVDQWIKVHQSFVGNAHARVPGPEVGSLRVDFDKLASLLYGRVGPIFDTRVAVDELAAISSPTPGDIERVRSQIVRPLHRKRFFARLPGPEWLAPLAAAGFFRDPPEREIYPDQSWRAVPWPAGEFLLRVAADAPTAVAAALATIPDTLENPIVWSIVADAVMALPPDVAGPLARKLAKGLRATPPVLVQLKAIRAATSLAQRGRAEAFDLLDTLLWTQGDLVPKRKLSESVDSYADRLRARRPQLLSSDSWVFARIDEYDFDRILAEVFPAAESLDAIRTLKLGARILGKIVHSVQGQRHDLRSRLEASEKAIANGDLDTGDASHSSEYSFDPYSAAADDAGATRRWCDDLTHASGHDNVREALAVTVCAIARRLAADAESASAAVELLQSFEGEIFERMGLVVLGTVDELDESLRSRVSAFIASEAAVSPQFGAKEVAPLLRAHFESATPAAQQAFLDRMTRGLPEDVVSGNIEFFERPDTPEERADVVARWQRTRIRWFHDKIPTFLRPLAETLGVSPAVPSAQQQSLDETGFWSSGGMSSGRDRTPMEVEEMAALDVDALIQYLASWKPEAAPADPRRAATVDGLFDALATLTRQYPDRIPNWIPGIREGRVPLMYVAAILEGARAALQQAGPMDRATALSLAEVCWIRAESAVERLKEDAATLRTARAICELMAEVIAEPATQKSEDLARWMVIAQIVASDFAWRVLAGESVPETFAEARQRSWNSVGGRALDLLLRVASDEFAALSPTVSWPPPATSVIAEKIEPILDEIVARGGSAGIAAQTILGDWLGRLFWMAPAWIERQLENLLDESDRSIAVHPALGAHLLRLHVTTPIFDRLRPWLARFASATVRGETASSDMDGGVSEKLLEYVTVAAVLGLVKPGDADKLLETAFHNSSATQRSHCYWLIWAWWSKEDPANVRGVHSNLVAFWDWRLRELESAAASSDRDEEVGGLEMLLATPHISLDDAIRLSARTVAMLRKGTRTQTMA